MFLHPPLVLVLPLSLQIQEELCSNLLYYTPGDGIALKRASSKFSVCVTCKSRKAQFMQSGGSDGLILVQVLGYEFDDWSALLFPTGRNDENLSYLS